MRIQIVLVAWLRIRIESTGYSFIADYDKCTAINFLAVLRSIGEREPALSSGVCGRKKA